MFPSSVSQRVVARDIDGRKDSMADCADCNSRPEGVKGNDS